ncbi:MAG: Crp/Fnr family transcriptional regulator [Zetaproteobacteria bacterium CG_4_9_14_3_um_filter_49_83]|nr:MAG: Crp/Fnr family transcriptional regulator [Zetaproteobacteria bacterium CG17_big_fil_post_rev_8_21_14_2_50_50_13]PIV30869.1 MAG: Crp/Fnr family transcriptional regulator [Zetaproteobacteria bacterium CG02_land_8_20_14_3_00_50_9]PIY56263.1 MAG: Crp/Fnr family transcriptional regulator [Zetaproteobacteria bacterium CG_4_10_14_0_8_um_filter_49_80]PJA34745.1 MAG: Crp/Fnr family transcriptional regulator [Zetaproteobacteria bacterium CG_4_9_14_3_um_filter_49_83]
MSSWIELFPLLASIKDEALCRDLSNIKVMTFSRGDFLFREGDDCRGYVLVISGSICVHKIDSEGREILLYRVEGGQNCMLTTTCLMGHQPYPAEAVVEKDVQLVLLPPALFERLLITSDAFRVQAMASIGQRICDMMLLIGNVAFGRINARVADILLRRDEDETGTVNCTHQVLASELGTAREVVSRMLKNFESDGMVALSRGEIRILNRKQLHLLADSLSV